MSIHTGYSIARTEDAFVLPLSAYPGSKVLHQVTLCLFFYAASTYVAFQTCAALAVPSVLALVAYHRH